MIQRRLSRKVSPRTADLSPPPVPATSTIHKEKVNVSSALNPPGTLDGRWSLPLPAAWCWTVLLSPAYPAESSPTPSASERIPC